MKTRENERRDSGILIILILLLGFICIILASGWAIRFAPSWRLNTNMGSHLDPNSDFLTSRPVSFIEPLDPAILTNPAWINVFLTPGALFETRTPSPGGIPTNIPPKTGTPLPTTIPATNTPTIVASPTNTQIFFPPPTTTPKPAASNTPVPQADLQVTKNDGVVSYNPGGTLTYTITVTNNGSNNVVGVVLRDNIPVQITTWTWVCTSQTGGATGCNGVAGSNTNFTDTVNVPTGASIVYTVTANVSAAATGNLINTATVNVPAGYIDPTPGNNSAIDTDTQFIPFSTDLQATKVDGVATYTPGNPLTYTVTITNNGPSAVVGAVITDNIPVQVTTWDWVCTAQNGGASGCNAVAGSNTNFTDTVNLPNGASIVYTVTANISAAAIGNLTNTATISVPAGYTDPIPGNNSATDTDTPILNSDLGITKTDGVATYVPGNALSYTVTVTNNGTSAVIGAVVTDNIPAQITTWTWACTSQTGGANGCDAVVGSNANFTDTVNLPNGASIVYTVTANVSAAASGNLTNTASVNVPVGYVDPTPGNNSATDTDTQFIPPTTDLQITKTDGVAAYVSGNTVTYTIIVTNNGPTGVIGAAVIDTFSTQITSANWTCTPSGGAACGAANGSGNINELVNMPVGSTITYTVTTNISASSVGTLTNTASVNVPVGVTDTNAGNNTATDSDAPSSTEPDIGGPDGTSTNLLPGGSITIVFSPPIIADGDIGTPDFVYYEILASPTTVDLDWVQIEISPDGVTWYQLFYWGDGVPDTNSNVDINVIGGLEDDNRSFLTTSLYNSTGITVDIDTLVPPGSYPWMRITSPAAAANGANIDAIQPYYP